MTLKRIFLCSLILVNLVFAYHLVIGSQGIFGYLKLKRDYEVLEQKLEAAHERSRILSGEILRLKADPTFLKDAIRQRMNFVGPGEILYVFPSSERGEASSNSAGAQGHEDKN